MANPFGLPKVLLEQREERQHRFRTAVYAVLITAVILIMGMLMVGCRTQGPATAEVSPQPVARGPILPPRLVGNPLPSSIAQTDTDTNWASPPENVTSSVQSSPASQVQVTTPEPAPTTTVHKTPAYHTAAGFYVVKSGDTLTRIARAHGTTIKALKTANHLTSDRIVVGQKLRLSLAAKASAVPN
jgi:LysM repeat protein